MTLWHFLFGKSPGYAITVHRVTDVMGGGETVTISGNAPRNCTKEELAEEVNKICYATNQRMELLNQIKLQYQKDKKRN